MITFDVNSLKWTRRPLDFLVEDGKIEITTKPHTNLWQRTYYHFRNDNAPVLHMGKLCGIASAAERTIIVLNALLTVRTSIRCVCVIC